MEEDFYKTAYPDRYSLLRFWARENRNHMTEDERLLWFHLRGNQLGHKFVRQHVIADYIVDFACLQKSVVIEVDGGYHAEPLEQESDQMRTNKLNVFGYRVVRFSNDEILYNIEQTLNRLKNILNE